MDGVFLENGLSKDEIDMVFGGSIGVFPDEMCHKKDKFVPLNEVGDCEGKCRDCFNLKFNQGFYCDA